LSGVVPGPWVITGTGLVSVAGDDPPAVFEALRVARPLGTDDESGYPAVRVPDFDPRRYVRRKGLKLLSRTSQLACAAASRLEPSLCEVPGDRVAVVFGTAWGSLDTIVRFEREAHTEGPRFVDPILFTETVANVPAGQISIFFGWSAVNATVSAGTASGLQAVERGLEFLDEGRADVVVAGGADELNEHLLRVLQAEGLVAPQGPVGAEGACLVAIESAAHAQARGAEALACVRGATSGFVDGEGDAATGLRADLLRGLLARVGWSARDVDLLVLSGNGSPERGRWEIGAVEALFGSRMPQAVVPKTVLGESWGAAGPLGITVALECLRRSELPADTRATPDGPLRRAIVLDCAASGQFAAVALSVME